MSSEPHEVARGPGPVWLRRMLVVLAVLYYIALVKRVPDGRWTRPIGFFTSATGLFTSSAVYKISYRLAAWSCSERKWLPLDVRAYFPIRAEDKESRFHRLSHFYKYNKTVLHALDDFVSKRHKSVDDGVTGSIGGVRLFQTLSPIPLPGSRVERFVFEPLAPIPTDGIRDLYYTPGSERKARCEGQR